MKIIFQYSVTQLLNQKKRIKPDIQQYDITDPTRQN